jgi:hypothetical protein
MQQHTNTQTVMMMMMMMMTTTTTTTMTTIVTHKKTKETDSMERSTLGKLTVPQPV